MIAPDKTIDFQAAPRAPIPARRMGYSAETTAAAAFLAVAFLTALAGFTAGEVPDVNDGIWAD
jgi:hypothetical protein